MHKDAGVEGDAEKLGELVWMFFFKIYEDQAQELEPL